ncbi:MAG: hypothetical protein Q7S40_17950 [Opitutaceae bacterium]|nr:hypothetical protein [Opitutaceae bacterium]
MKTPEPMTSDTKVKAALRNMMPNAKVQVTGVAFTEWNSAQTFSTGTFTLWTLGGRVRQFAGTNNLKVAGPATIEFILMEKQYIPKDVVFTQVAAEGVQPDVNGHRNFPPQEVKLGRYASGESYVQVTNLCHDKGGTGRRVTWDYYIEVEVNGTTGRLHPEISNSDDTQAHMGGPKRRRALNRRGRKLAAKPASKKHTIARSVAKRRRSGKKNGRP